MKDYQLDGSDCGASCLRYVVKHYGGNISLERARNLTYTTKDGTNMYHLKRAFLQLGFSANGYMISIQQLNNYRLPLMAMIKFNHCQHFVVIKKVTAKYIYLFDPAVGNKRYLITDFKIIFSGYVLTFKPRMPLVQEEERHELKVILKTLIINHQLKLILLILLSILLAVLMLLDSLFLKIIIDQFSNLTFNSLMIIVIFFILVLTTKEILVYLHTRLVIKIGYQLERILTDKVLSRLLSLPIAFFNNRQVGEIIARLQGIEHLHQLLIEVCSNLLIGIIFFVMISIYLIKISLSLYLMIMLFIIILMIVLMGYHYYLKNILNNVYRHLDEFNQRLITTFNNINTIYHLQIGLYIKNKIIKSHQSYLSDYQTYQHLQSIKNLIKGLIYLATSSSVMIYSIYLTKNNILTLGLFVQINVLLSFMIQPIERLFMLEDVFRTAMINYQRLDQIYSVTPLLTSRQSLSEIRMNEISYAYNGIDYILKGFNAKFELGDKVFISGPSGSGKSTIFKLLSHYDYRYQGKMSLSCFNQQIIYVSQQENIFNTSLKENIVLDQPLNNRRLKQIIKLMQLDYLQHDSELSAHNISGGERQRIIIARALYRPFSALILDEALSQVDPSLSEFILKAIINYYPSKIIIYASHQSPNLQLFNKIIVIERSQKHVII